MTETRFCVTQLRMPWHRWRTLVFSAVVGPLLLSGASGCAFILNLANNGGDIDLSKVDGVKPKTKQQKKADYESWIANYEKELAKDRQEVAQCNSYIKTHRPVKVYGDGGFEDPDDIRGEEGKRYYFEKEIYRVNKKLAIMQSELRILNEEIAEEEKTKATHQNTLKDNTPDPVRPMVRPPTIKPGC